MSLINLAAIWAGADDIPAFRSMRTLRALRPLRAVSRWEGMRVSSAPARPPTECRAPSLRARCHRLRRPTSRLSTPPFATRGSEEDGRRATWDGRHPARPHHHPSPLTLGVPLIGVRECSGHIVRLSSISIALSLHLHRHRSPSLALPCPRPLS